VHSHSARRLIPLLMQMKNLCNDGALEKCGPSEWGSPTFITKKKDGYF